jgi:hypothetical protein
LMHRFLSSLLIQVVGQLGTWRMQLTEEPFYASSFCHYIVQDLGAAVSIQGSVFFNIIGLFCLTMSDYGLATVRIAQVPFLVNLDTLLHLVSSTKVCLSWPTARRNYTVAAYKLLESLFLLYTHWFYCLKSTVPGAEIVDVGRSDTNEGWTLKESHTYKKRPT